jgi:ribosomal protein S18 acetylase RimI-like enzyme
VSECEIVPFDGEPEELFDFLKLNTSLERDESRRWLIDIELARGTRYYLGVVEGRRVGFVGLRLPPTHELAGLEPPEIIDIAVLPDFRRRGIGRAMIEHAAEGTRRAGHDVLWVSTDADHTGNLSFYRACGFRLAAAVPNGWGPGWIKAIMRRELSAGQ